MLALILLCFCFAAVVTAPLMGAEARGRVGGVVHNTWRGRSYVKAKTAPSQPRTHLQLAMRAMAIMISRKWQSLSPTVQGLWDDYSTNHKESNWTGTSIRLTAANWYQRCNTTVLRMGFPMISAPPTVPAPAPMTAFALAVSAGHLSLTWAPDPTANIGVQIWTSGPHSPGQVPRMEKARYYDTCVASGGTYALTAPTPGSWDVWIRTSGALTGLTSGWQVQSAVVT